MVFPYAALCPSLTWWLQRAFSSPPRGEGTALIGGTGTDTIDERLPGQRGPATMWAWMGSPFIRVAQPFVHELTDEVRADLADGAKARSLDCRILEDELGWRCPGWCLPVVWMLRETGAAVFGSLGRPPRPASLGKLLGQLGRIMEDHLGPAAK